MKQKKKQNIRHFIIYEYLLM